MTPTSAPMSCCSRRSTVGITGHGSAARKREQAEANGLQPREQVAQGCGVGVEGGATALAERDRGSRCDPVAGFFGTEVAGVFEFAQMRDQVPGRQPDHFL